MRLRAAFLADHPLCVACLEADRLTPATIAHHRLERLERPDLALDPANLEPYCRACHSRHHKRSRPDE
jgi:5-methylcytosine-specific restriction protein A